MKISQKNFENILIFVLVAACMFHPAAAAAGLALILASQTAERYFTKNISDKDRQMIGELSQAVTKHSEILSKQGLAQAFGGKK